MLGVLGVAEGVAGTFSPPRATPGLSGHLCCPPVFLTVCLECHWACPSEVPFRLYPLPHAFQHNLGMGAQLLLAVEGKSPGSSETYSPCCFSLPAKMCVPVGLEG